VLLGQFMQKKAVERGVRYQVAHVTHANLDEQGNIASVATREGLTLSADLFVDCTGFAALLIDQALKTPYVSFAENLFNDAAVALPTPLGDTLPSETVSTALKAGWMWKIPLTQRFGNGYVYSSQACSADLAERELRETLGLLDADVPARHLKMKIGRVTRHWNKNCVAIGLSQGFIEPLEATALLFIQQTAAAFVSYLEQGDLSEAAHDRFNAHVNEHFEGTRDYIVTHYKTNSRSDTEYWRANAANQNLSEPLKQLLNVWMSGNGIAAAVRQQRLGKGYPVFSWYSLMAGMGIFPNAHTLHPAQGKEALYGIAEIDDLLDRSEANYRDHREVLDAIPPRRAAPGLQVYFW
jgi:tryptophan 6-halogenase